LKSLWGLAKDIEEAAVRHNHIRIHGLQAGLNQMLLLFLSQRAVQKPERNFIIVYKNRFQMERAVKAFSGFRGTGSWVAPLILPETDLWGKERFASKKYLQNERLRGLSGLCYGGGQVVFTTPQGLLQTTLRKDLFLELCLGVTVGDIIDMDQLIQNLTDLSYHEVDRIEEAGQYSRRGGILDIFPLAIFL
jgi:transcription-repair coupling factor (superfamily II helicase)